MAGRPGEAALPSDSDPEDADYVPGSSSSGSERGAETEAAGRAPVLDKRKGKQRAIRAGGIFLAEEDEEEELERERKRLREEAWEAERRARFGEGSAGAGASASAGAGASAGASAGPSVGGSGAVGGSRSGVGISSELGCGRDPERGGGSGREQKDKEGEKLGLHADESPLIAANEVGSAGKRERGDVPDAAQASQEAEGAGRDAASFSGQAAAKDEERPESIPGSCTGSKQEEGSAINGREFADGNAVCKMNKPVDDKALWAQLNRPMPRKKSKFGNVRSYSGLDQKKSQAEMLSSWLGTSFSRGSDSRREPAGTARTFKLLDDAELEAKDSVNVGIEGREHVGKVEGSGGGGLGEVLKKVREVENTPGVLEKSRASWEQFKESDEEVKGALESYRKDKTRYTDKVAFLRRTELREWEKEQSNKTAGGTGKPRK